MKANFQVFNRIALLLLLGTTLSCSDNVILEEALRVDDPVTSTGNVSSGDIFIVSGGTVGQTTSPYPLHMITQWSSSGAYIRTIAQSPITTTFYYGADIDPTGTYLYYGVETVDRVDRVDLSTLTTTTAVLDANLTGTTIRGMAMLSDGGMIVAESTTSIEKFNSAGVRVTTNFPLTLTANINNVKRISGGRFAVMISGNPDNVRIYTNAGVLSTTLTGPACGTNCDPYDIVELDDGRFLVSNQVTHALELYNSSFTYVAQAYLNTSVMITPGAMAKLADGSVLVCSTALNTCERFTISGNALTRVGTQAMISDASLMRQPTSVTVMP